METGGVGAVPTPRDAASVLLPYVPRLVTEWACTAPSERWRPIRGTMVFADLSGFTAMSERLARLGRVGAEEVTDAIATCFSTLLGVAYDAGGGLLKFGGDALLLAFVGPEHRQRAVWSAAAMRERLRDVGTLTTAAGNVRLRMSVGVHSGTFDCFLVGSPSRELIVTGAAASTCVAMEHVASAGQIVVSRATAAALPDGCIGEAIGDGLRLRRAPARPDVRPDDFVAGAFDLDLREFVPQAVHEHVLAGGGAAEHRVVTVAFVHFDGLDRRVADDGPERTAAALDELVTTVARECASHGVALLASDVDADGGKFVLTAGAPSLHGHDEERMLAAVRRIVDAGLAIPVRAGVNRGAVFAGDVGPPYRRTYTVMGDTVNLAARLMAAAEPGRVVATAAVLDRAPGFAATALPPMQVKGKRAPVHAFEVGRASHGGHDGAARPAIELPFVGRGEERARLEELLARAQSGRGESIAVVGDAGAGKTRLLAEVSGAVPSPPVRIVCEAYEIATPYAAVAQLLRNVLALPDAAASEDAAGALREAIAIHAPDLVPWLPLLSGVIDVPIADTPESASLAPRFRAARTAAATATLLASVMPPSSVVVIDDADWIDDASRDIVDVLATLVDDAGIVLACVGRTEQSLPRHTTTIPVGPLARADVEVALRRATEHAPLRPHVLVALADRADGNPLFLSELWRAATEGDDGELPDSVEALVTAQLDRLPPALRTLLGYAAVLGRSFDQSELSALAAADLPVGDQTWVAITDFVELDGSRARFRHALLRDAAYARLPFRRRRELHERTARAIQGRGHARRAAEAELLSLHFLAAHVYPEAWDYARLAANRARERYANVEAAALYDRALAAARHLPDLDAVDVAAVREALGEVHDRNGEYERALLDFRVARRLVRGDAVREAELLLKEAWIPERIGKYKDAVRTIRKGLALVEGFDAPAAGRARAQLLAWYAAIRQGQGRHREAITLSARAIDEAVGAADRDAEAHARFVHDWAYTDLGELERVTNLPRALELYTELSDLTGQGLVLNFQGACAYWRGDWDGAVGLYERAVDAYDRAGSAVDAARAAANIAEVLSDQGHFAEADGRLRTALAVSVAAGYHYDIALITGFLGRNSARADRLDDALAFLESSRAEYAAAGLSADVLRVDAWRAEALTLAGDAPAALALAEATLRLGRAEGGTSAETPLLERIRAQALLQLGDLDGARTAIRASVDAARARDAQYDLAMALDVVVRTPELRSQVEPDRLDELLAGRDALFARFSIVRGED